MSRISPGLRGRTARRLAALALAAFVCACAAPPRACGGSGPYTLANLPCG